MIDLLEENSFWEFCAEHNTFIQHTPGSKGKKNRFARYNAEGTIGEIGNLGWMRLEVRDNPTGSFNLDKYYIWDRMIREVRAITKVAVNNFNERKLAQNECKKALAQIVQFVVDQKQDGERCASKLIQRFDVNSVRYEIIESATSDGTFTGCNMRVEFRASMNVTGADYGTFVYPGTGGSS